MIFQRMAGALLVAGVAVFSGGMARGQTVLSSCTEAELRSACERGGLIEITCSGEIEIRQPILISKRTEITSKAGVKIAGAGNRLFEVEGGVEFALSGVTLTRGLATHGGAILTAGTVRASKVRFEGNQATGYVSVEPIPAHKGGGGAIYSLRGTVVADQCEFIGNQASGSTQLWRSPGYGGAIVNDAGTIEITVSSFSANLVRGSDELERNPTYPAWPAEGGAIWNGGTAIIRRTRFFSNGAVGSFGARGIAAANLAKGGAGSQGAGGAIYNADRLNMEECTFEANSAYGGLGGAGLDEADPFSGATGGEGGAARGGAIYSASGSLAMSGCTFDANLAAGGNGGSGGRGRKGSNARGFSRGETGSQGGMGGPGEGGGVHLNGQITLTNSTWHANLSAGGAGGAGGEGGEPGQITDAGGLRMSGDGGIGGKGGASHGAAIYLASGNQKFLHLTIARNSLVMGEGGPGGTPGIGGADGTYTPGGFGQHGMSGPQAGATVYTLVPPDVQATIFAHDANENYHGPINDLGHNCSTQTTPVWTDPTSFVGDPALGILTMNGGETKTMLPLSGSPVLERIPQPLISIDQRGVRRPQGQWGDIGAVEREASELNPRLSVVAASSAVLTIRVHGKTGQRITLESSESFQNWLPVASEILSAQGRIDFDIPWSTPSLFFRAVADGN